MRELEEYTYTHTYTRKRCVAAVCDICGKVNKCYEEDPVDWARSGWRRDKVVITHTTGDVYPEYHEITHEHFDCCPDCFETVIRPLFKTGPHIVKEES